MSDPATAASPAAARQGPVILVVSLADASERRAGIRRALGSLGLSFEFIDGVDARRGVPLAFTAEVDRSEAPEVTEVELGCSLSHALAYRYIVEHSIPHAIIMEDDAIPTELLVQFIEERCHERAPLIQLYHQAAYVRRLGRQQAFPGVYLTQLATNCSGTVAYSLDLATAKVLRKATTPVRGRADWPVDLRSLGACVTQPVMVSHPPDRDDSVIGVSHSRDPRGLQRLLNRSYYRTKWRRLFAKRVHGHREARARRS